MVGPEQLQAYVRGNVLKRDEEVQWQGRSIAPTDRRRKYLGDHPSTVLSGYGLMLIGLFTLMALHATWISFFAVLIGAWFAGAPFRLARRLKNTFHFITSERVLIVQVGQRVRTQELGLSDAVTVMPFQEHLQWSSEGKPRLVFEFCSDCDGALRAFEQMRKTDS